VEIFAYKRYFYLEAQSFTLDGHPELFVWLWFLGNSLEVQFVERQNVEIQNVALIYLP
jgi:hypothetical protein